MLNRSTQMLLNVGHAIDHMFLLIFATAVTAIAQDFGMARWEDLMPWGVLAFFCFGLGSLPSGKLGDQWGRRKMMLVFFFGMGAAAIGVSLADSPLQLALALGLLGCFASIYHPVGIPMLLQGAARPGWTHSVALTFSVVSFVVPMPSPPPGRGCWCATWRAGSPPASAPARP